MRNLFLVTCLLGGMSFSQQPPKTMTKVEVVLQSPDVPAGSFASKPKVMYRAGSRYCRVEEAPDPDKGIHGLLIISEPDYWMVNLLTKAGRHGVDSGPTFNCRMPIFPEISGLDLEFGLELDYFKSRGVTPTPGPVLQTKQTTAYRVDVGDSTWLYSPMESQSAHWRLRVFVETRTRSTGIADSGRLNLSRGSSRCQKESGLTIQSLELCRSSVSCP
jgi:hypothetical protein